MASSCMWAWTAPSRCGGCACPPYRSTSTSRWAAVRFRRRTRCGRSACSRAIRTSSRPWSGALTAMPAIPASWSISTRRAGTARSREARYFHRVLLARPRAAPRIQQLFERVRDPSYPHRQPRRGADQRRRQPGPELQRRDGARRQPAHTSRTARRSIPRRTSSSARTRFPSMFCDQRPGRFGREPGPLPVRRPDRDIRPRQPPEARQPAAAPLRAAGRPARALGPRPTRIPDGTGARRVRGPGRARRGRRRGSATAWDLCRARRSGPGGHGRRRDGDAWRSTRGLPDTASGQRALDLDATREAIAECASMDPYDDADRDGERSTPATAAQAPARAGPPSTRRAARRGSSARCSALTACKKADWERRAQERQSARPRAFSATAGQAPRASPCHDAQDVGSACGSPRPVTCACAATARPSRCASIQLPASDPVADPSSHLLYRERSGDRRRAGEQRRRDRPGDGRARRACGRGPNRLASLFPRRQHAMGRLERRPRDPLHRAARRSRSAWRSGSTRAGSACAGRHGGAARPPGRGGGRVRRRGRHRPKRRRHLRRGVLRRPETRHRLGPTHLAFTVRSCCAVRRERRHFVKRTSTSCSLGDAGVAAVDEVRGTRSTGRCASLTAAVRSRGTIARSWPPRIFHGILHDVLAAASTSPSIPRRASSTSSARKASRSTTSIVREARLDLDPGSATRSAAWCSGAAGGSRSAPETASTS